MPVCASMEKGFDSNLRGNDRTLELEGVNR